MISLLSGLYIKKRNCTDELAIRNIYGMASGVVGIVCNIFLFIMKFAAGLFCGSIAIMADAFNNLSDAGTSVITLLGMKLAAAKPDSKHPFGHGRMEYVTGLAVSAVIILMGLELMTESVKKVFHPEETLFSPVVAVILLVSIFIKALLAVENKTLGKRLDSAVMSAVGTDSLTDVASTSMVLLAMVIGYRTSLHVDGFFGLLVALLILYAGVSAAREMLDPLLGQPPRPEFVAQIQDIVLSQEGIIGIHDLVVHDYGPGRVMISLHGEVPADVDVMVSHERIDATERLLQEKLSCEAVIHMDPVVVNDERVVTLKRQVEQLVHAWQEDAAIHDFRVVFGVERTNLIFDVVVPYEMKEPVEEMQDELTSLIQKEIGVQYVPVMTIEHSYLMQ